MPTEFYAFIRVHLVHHRHLTANALSLCVLIAVFRIGSFDSAFLRTCKDVAFFLSKLLIVLPLAFKIGDESL